MPQRFDDSESYEEHTFSLDEFKKRPDSHVKKIVLTISVAVVVFVVLFMVFTAEGGNLAQNGSAVFVKSFRDAFGLRVPGNISQVIEASNDAVDFDEPSSSIDVAMSTSSPDFPETLPKAVPKAGISKPAGASKARSSVSSKSQADGADDFSDGTLMADLSLPPATARTGLAAVVTPARTSSSVSVPENISRVAKITPTTTASPVVAGLVTGLVMPVSVAVSGDGRGFVSSTPAGISCDGYGTCLWNFPIGSKVALRATHDTMSSFGGWSGACSGTAAACTVVIGNGPMMANAIFRLNAAAFQPASSSFAGAAGKDMPQVDPVGDLIAIATGTDTTASSEAPSSNPGAAATTVLEAASSASSIAEIPAFLNHLVIAAVQVAGESSANDFVKVYNPTALTVDVGGWKLHKRSNTGADYSLKTFAKGTSILPGAYLVWGNSANGFADSIGADVSGTQTLAADNSVALLDASGAAVDAVAWGNGSGQYGEGPPFPTTPAANQSLARKTTGGAMIDTDDNREDFELK